MHSILVLRVNQKIVNPQDMQDVLRVPRGRRPCPAGACPAGAPEAEDTMGGDVNVNVSDLVGRRVGSEASRLVHHFLQRTGCQNLSG